MSRGSRRGMITLLAASMLGTIACTSSGNETISTQDTIPTTAAPAVVRSSGSSSTTMITVATTAGPAASASPTTTPSATIEVPTTTPAPCAPLSTEEQIALLVWPSVYSADWETARQVVRENGLGGVLLMKPSGWDGPTIAARLAELEDESPHGLVVATDEEGGDVQRLSGVSLLASQNEVSTSMSPADASALIAGHAGIVSSLGIDVVMAPVVDVLPTEGSPPLRRSRFFTGGPEDVAAYATAYVDAWLGAGVLPVLKHYPGHGQASGDTHVSDGITADLATLEARDLIPYRLLADSGAGVMVGHLVTPNLSDGLPASRSDTAIEYLRDDIGFADALVVSDSLDMDAVGVPVPQAAVESITAGVDVVLFTDPSIAGDVIDAISVAVVAGTIPASTITESARKVWALLEHPDQLC